MSCHSLAENFRDYFLSPVFSRDWAAEQARRQIEHGEHLFEELEATRWEYLNTSDRGGFLVDIKVVMADRLRVVSVGERNYATAHEAAHGYLEQVQELWRMHDGGENEVDECFILAERFEALKCPDLYAMIEIEYYAASTELDDHDSDDNTEYSAGHAPSHWAKLFDVSWKTLKRRIDKSEVRARKINAQSWQFHLADLPK